MIKIMTLNKAPLLACLLALLTSTVSAESIRYGVITPKDHPWTLIMEQFKTNVETASNQNIHVKESRFVKVRGEASIVEMLKNGQLQAGIVAVGGLTTFDPTLNGWLVPYQFTNINQLGQSAESDEAKNMLASLENYDLIALGYVFSGMHQLMSPKAINTVEELKGKRVQSFANDVFYNWYRQLGANPQVVQIQDVRTQLERGELDAVDCDLATAVSLKIYELAPNLMLTNHMASPGIFVVPAKWWANQTEEQQALITRAFTQAEQWGFERLQQSEKDNLKQLRDKGVNIQEFSEADFNGVPQKLRDFYSATNPRIKAFAAGIQ